MGRYFVKIVNRGDSVYTSGKRAEIFVLRKKAEIVTGDPMTGRIVEIRMIEPDEKRQAIPTARKSRSRSSLHRVSASRLRTVGHRGNSSYFKASGGAHASSEDSQWRSFVLGRDGHMCTQCGATDQLEADHIKPKHLYPALRYEVSNGRTLCKPCPMKTDTYGRKVHRLLSVEVSPE